MPARKIKVVDVISDTEPKGQTPNDDEPTPKGHVKPIEDIPQPTEQDTLYDTPVEQEPQQVEDEMQPQDETPVSSIKTVELVECPDCKKKMTKNTLKYSHAKNCIKKKEKSNDSPQGEEDRLVLPVVKEEEEEEEEVKPSTPPPPKLKRTVSEKTQKQTQPIKKTISKVKQPQPSQQPQQQTTPTITNIYGREHRNEMVKMKSQKMNTLFVNAI